MFETMIVMAPSDICGSIIAELERHNPSLCCRPVTTGPELQALPGDLLARARLISFTNSVIVPPDTLAALGYGAYNFHPGPPHQPGLSPAQFAIYQGSQIFGATVHVMVEKVDAGPIVGAEFCLIAPGATVLDLEAEAATLLVRLFRALAPQLACSPAPLPTLPVTWSAVKSTRRKFAELCEIPLDIAPDELDRRIRAFASNHFGLEPTVTLHGHRFRYSHPAPALTPVPMQGEVLDAAPDLAFAPSPAQDATRAIVAPTA